MRFIRVTHSDPVANYLTAVLHEHLAAGEHVLWLVAGGSVIDIAVTVAQRLAGTDLSIKNLTVSLTDERYGEVGHPDSNWQQLMDTGFDLPEATLVPVLESGSRDDTAARWGTWLEPALEQNAYAIALFGVGPDGHVAGMLPETSSLDSADWAIGYDGGQYQRVTMTGRAMAALDEAVVYMAGEAKGPVVERLATNLPPAEQPAQLLKTIPTVTVFNDHQGDPS